jgi:hypothetical protein
MVNAALATGSAVASAARIFDGAKRMIGKFGQTVSETFGTDFQTELARRVEKEPIQGPDVVKLNGPILTSGPMEKFYDDLLRQSSPRSTGGLLVLMDDFGKGKSFTAHAATRGWTGVGPKRYLVLTPDVATTGDEWASDMKSLAGASGQMSSSKFVKVLAEVMKDTTIETEKQFGLHIKDFKHKLAHKQHAHRAVDRRGAVLMEDCNPTDLEDDSVYDACADHAERRALLLADTKRMGEAFSLLSGLACSFHPEGLICIVTTKHRRVARALHFLINGGTKCKIASSLITDGANYNPSTFDFDVQFHGLLWSSEDRLSFLKRKFSLIKNHHAIEELARNTDISIRIACDQLAILMDDQACDSSLPSMEPASSSSSGTAPPASTLLSDLTCGTFGNLKM